MIITINIPDDYMARMDDLIGAGVYPNRSEILRIALHRFVKKELEHALSLERDTFIDLIRDHVKQDEVKKEKKRKPRPVKKNKIIMNPNLRNHEFTQLAKPKKLYKVFPRELYFNYVISHLAEHEGFMTIEHLSKLLGVHVSYASIIIKRIEDNIPNLITRHAHARCKLNKKNFEKLLKKGL